MSAINRIAPAGLVAATALLLPIPALASDFSGLAPFFFAAIALLVLLVLTPVFLVSRLIRHRMARQALRALGLSALFAPVFVTESYDDGSIRQDMVLLSWHLLTGPDNASVSAVQCIPAAVFFLLLTLLAFAVSRGRERERQARTMHAL